MYQTPVTTTSLSMSVLPSLSVDDSSSALLASQRFVSEACLEFLIMETVDTMFRTTLDAETDREAVFYKLEMLGYRVGQSLVERLTKDRPRFVDTLDVVKFVCKDLWTIAFKKQIDNLKTNHRGVFVLQDNNFRWFMRMSTETGAQDSAKKAAPYLWFPCGLIRGALANLGVVSVVIAETHIPNQNRKGISHQDSVSIVEL
ncbi:transport protein particle component-domain-containing protein [Jimgerdemannia flammicorona]|uniref:Transport protein particle component-domain-containing protein n=1 Tax=Jimgerdemannia flammicorona TaxID=994334 RepID=A0A433A065_9FUNG|nr:transport protein particle component-domain-containing protein [Jimgerdemannia flammicorona]